MPFFVGKLDQAMADLSRIVSSDASREIKAEAPYWLGAGYQKKATAHWIKVISEYGKTDAARAAFASMRPEARHFDPQKYSRPYLAIDFVLGFRDELPPQTAVWIEDKSGNFIKTVYVSGFSGHVKEKQANLTDWAKASKFSDVDSVTGASIDLGHHVCVWDLKDQTGKRVKNGDYVVKVEMAFWPSMEYQSVAAKVTLGVKDCRVVVEEENLVPYLMVQHYTAD